MPVNADHDVQDSPPGFWGSRYAIGFLVIGTVAGYFLLTEHRAHVVGALPYLLLLACPLIHVFMHRGHDHRHDQGGNGVRPGSPDQPKRGEPA